MLIGPIHYHFPLCMACLIGHLHTMNKPTAVDKGTYLTWLRSSKCSVLVEKNTHFKSSIIPIYRVRRDIGVYPPMCRGIMVYPW